MLFFIKSEVTKSFPSNTINNGCKIKYDAHQENYQIIFSVLQQHIFS